MKSSLIVITGLKRFDPLFLLTVVIPTLIAIVYFGIFANHVYVSESRFVVRSPSRASTSPLGYVLSGGALSAASEESNAVYEYLKSRDALNDANKDGFIRRAYGAARIFWFDRFGSVLSGKSEEELFIYFSDKVHIEQDSASQVTQLTVRAYDPREAKEINRRLLDRSEALVNRMSDRARGDAIAVARSEVAEAEAASRQAALTLARYRTSEGIIDPEKEATVRLQMISKLQDELISSRTQLRQIETYTPQATQRPFLRTQIRSLEREIAEQVSEVAGGRRSLSTAAARFQELSLASKLAEKQLGATLTSLQEAQAEARRKRAYVERVAEPNTPDYAVEPRRIRGIAATFLLGLILWGVLSTLIVGIREHRD
jgi:BexC/CtrB/KpsE family polysaccharide export inner-membrane protein